MVPSKQVIASVDDDRRVRDSLHSVLESAGYEPRVFASAEEFLGSGALGLASCLIADVRMPGIDGIELQRRVRALRPELPIFFLTAHDDERVRQQALGGGAVEFIVKPFDAGELLNTLARTLEAPWPARPWRSVPARSAHRRLPGLPEREGSAPPASRGGGALCVLRALAPWPDPRRPIEASGSSRTGRR